MYCKKTSVLGSLDNTENANRNFFLVNPIPKGLSEMTISSLNIVFFIGMDGHDSNTEMRTARSHLKTGENECEKKIQESILNVRLRY